MTGESKSRHRSGTGAVMGTGLTVLDLIYADGRTQPLEALGGSCGNVLISLSMLGHCVSPLMAIGDDARGCFLFDEFERAGCETRYVFKRQGWRSPAIVEHVDVKSAHHWFSFDCPETDEAFPRWSSIAEEEVDRARDALLDTLVFYADRLTPAILRAMEAARENGAAIVFEPSGSMDWDLFDRAVRLTSILKLTAASPFAHCGRRVAPIEIVTLGELGLTIVRDGDVFERDAAPAPRLIDTCGAGDMVTTGLLDHLLRSKTPPSDWTTSDLLEGVRIGQRLAALNCGFAGARGLFHAVGAAAVRSGIDDGVPDGFAAYAMNFGPYDGYGLTGHSAA